MKARLLVLMLLTLPLYAMTDEPTPPTQSLEVSSVTAIQIVGEASAISLTTAEDGPFVATLGGKRTGWFANWYSSWFYNDCRMSSRITEPFASHLIAPVHIGIDLENPN